MNISILKRNFLLKLLLKLHISNLYFQSESRIESSCKEKTIGFLLVQNISGERKQIIFQNGICRFWEELFIYWRFSRKATPTEINKVSYERHREAEASIQPQMVWPIYIFTLPGR